MLITVENSLATLQSEHNKALREIDSKIDELKRSVPAHILSMKLCDVFKLEDFTDVAVEEKVTNLNVTVKETIQKADEGESTFISVFGALVSLSSLLTPNTRALSHLSSLFLHTFHPPPPPALA